MFKPKLTIFNSADTFSSISKMRESSVRNIADIRFYCDEDVVGPPGRWTIVPDTPGDPHPNSRRTRGVDQEVEDKTNHIKMGIVTTATGSVATIGLQDRVTKAETFYLWNSNQPADGENPTRSTITVIYVLL
jgi:hypothetical protein